jgi:hypothetical protein
MSKEAMKLALERIADPRNTHFAGDAQVVAREALAIAEAEKQEQGEPVAILNHAHGIHAFRSVNLQGLPDGEYRVYTTPPAQPAPVQEPVAIHCKAKRENNGVCPNHNLQCGWPKCNEPVWDCCANCMRPEHEHTDGQCPKPFTTIWNAWDYNFPPDTTPPAAQPAKQEQGEPVAMRYDFDGYGYKYIDSGSGSDWQTRIKDAEPLYTTPYVPTGRQPVTDEQIEAKFKQCGGKWNGDQWVIEDADLHPFVRSIESPDLKTLQAVSDEYNAWIRHHAAGHTYDDFLAKREAAHGIKE